MDTLARRVVSRFIQAHEQTCVTVHAYVDTGISKVIEALNLIPRVHTVASCQGDYHEATVWLRFGDYQEKLPEGRRILYDQADFYVWFHGKLFSSNLLPENYKLIVSGVIGTDEIEFTLKFDDRITDEMADAIRKIAQTLGGRP